MNRRFQLLLIVILAVALAPAVFGQSAATGRTLGPSVPANVVVAFRSNVRGAVVTVNGENQGTIPMELTLPQGTYNVSITAPGYSEFNRTITVQTSMQVTAMLVRVNYNLNINSNVEGADVYLNGRRVGRAPLTTRLPPGQYNLRVEKNGYQVFERHLTVNQDTSFNARLERRMAVLHIRVPDRFLNIHSVNGRGDRNRAERDIQVFIDNRRVESDNFRIPEGNHTIRIESGSLMVEQNFHFNGGQSYVISPELSIRIQ